MGGWRWYGWFAAHFASFGEYHLAFEAVYYVSSADYNVYMDVQQKINLAVKEAFNKNGVEFAYPTRTVRLLKEGVSSGF